MSRTAKIGDEVIHRSNRRQADRGWVAGHKPSDSLRLEVCFYGDKATVFLAEDSAYLQVVSDSSPAGYETVDLLSASEDELWLSLRWSERFMDEIRAMAERLDQSPAAFIESALVTGLKS